MSQPVHTPAKPSYTLFLRRAAAYLLDIVILFPVLFLLAWVVNRLTGFSPESGVQIWKATILYFSIPGWLYFTLSDSLAGGQTLGKRLLKLKVITQSGGALTFLRALLRTAVKLLPWELAHVGGFALQAFPVLQWVALGLSNVLILVYLAVAFAAHGRRSVHDWIARTEVVGDKR